MVAKFKTIKKALSWRDIIFPVLMVGLLVIIVGFLVVSNYRINKRRAELGARIDELKAEIQILEERRQGLEAKISQADQDSYLEKEARERFNLKKPGEEVVAIIQPDAKSEESKAVAKQWWNPLTS